MVVKTPPMGWNSWNTFGPNINEALIRETADVMVDSGLAAAGYNYLVIDDCWSEKFRDEQGRLVASAEKFPNGMKAVADYVHSKGLKFGMYSCAGIFTCARYPSSYGYEFIDADTFASWGVDFLKYDYCNKPAGIPGHLLYKRMGTALANCGRDILFSACSWGADETHKWVKSTGAHMWRSTGDIVDNWESIKNLTNRQIELQPYNGNGCFNDMDMLVVGMHGKGNVGVGGCTEVEYRTHFTIWAFFNSPLMIGCDIRNMSEETKAILMDKDIIAVNQDPAGRQPYQAIAHPDYPVWAKHMDNGDIVLAYFNLGEHNFNQFVTWADIGIERSSGVKLELTDLWSKQNLGIFDTGIEFGAVEPHGCRILRCRVVRG